jgi:hypothetical protein
LIDCPEQGLFYCFLINLMERMPMVEHGVSQANITEVEETQKRLSLKPIAALSLSALALTGASGHNLAHESEPAQANPLDRTTELGQMTTSHAVETPPIVVTASKPQRAAHLTKKIQVLPDILRRIGGCESGYYKPYSPIRYWIKNRNSSASGGFQITDGTWGGFKGYSHANQAPKRIQIWKAKILMHPKNGGLHNWDESRDCWEY